MCMGVGKTCGRRIGLAATIAVLLVIGVAGQSPTNIGNGGTLPTTCRNGDLFYKTGTSSGLYEATTAGVGTCVWTLNARGSVTATGTLTAGKFLIGNGTTDLTVGSLTASVVKSASGTLSAATSGTDYAPATTGSLPLFGNGAGGFTNGTVQGNTTKVVTYAGSAPATNDCAKFDASGNLATNGSACGSGGGGSGTTYNLGSLVLLASQTASSSATLDFTTRNATGQSGAIFQADYDDYVIEIVGALPVTDNVDMQLTFSSDGGSSWIAANYSMASNNSGSHGFIGGNNQSSAAFMYLGGGVENTTSASLSNFSIKLFNPTSSTRYKGLIFQTQFFGVDGNQYAMTGMGMLKDVTAVNAVRFAYSSGNIAEGTFRVYGIANQATTTTPAVAGLLAQPPVVCTSSAVATGTGRIPNDDTVPQNTEGDEYLTCSITPTNAASTLVITGTLAGSCNSAASSNMALFQDSTANALISAFGNTSTAGSWYMPTTLPPFSMTAGTTASTTFKLRASCSTGTMTVNGFASARVFGAQAKSSMSITEYRNALPALGPTNFPVANGRLTTESGVPVSTSDRTSQSTIYWTPYNGNQLGLYTSGVWGVLSVAETSLALSGLTSGKNYDVFGYSNAGTLALELSAAWSSDTARTDAVSLQDGVYVKTSDKSRRLLGTIRTTGTTTTEDSLAKRFVWNMYNPVSRSMRRFETTATWNYSTQTWRQANNSAANQVEYVTGDVATFVAVTLRVRATNTLNNFRRAGVGLDSVTAPTGIVDNLGDAPTQGLTGMYQGTPGLGYHYISWMEYGASAGTVTWYGQDAGGLNQYGLYGQIQN